MTDDEERYFLDSDDDGHWYLIPCDRVNEWDNWNEAMALDQTDITPEGCTTPTELDFSDCRIAGAPRWVTFVRPVDTIS